MFKSFVSHLGTLEVPPPWGVWSGINAALFAFFAVILCTGIVLAVLGVTQFTALLGWALADGLVLAFIYFSRRAPEKRAALHFDAPQTAEPGRASALQSALLLALIGVGVGIALDVIGQRLTEIALPVPELLPMYLNAVGNNFPLLAVSWLLAFILLVIAEPLAEALVFQGILLPALRNSLGAWGGYIVSAALFALYHLLIYASPSGDFITLWYALIAPFVAGLFFAAVRLYTGSTRSAVISQAAYGLFALVNLLTLVSR